ncbi:hypothetical protein OAH61_04865 [Flavobacteriaceae bacterium]|jgi:hypothetical protein|nr:hypothetical protein [Flavobacteriaceae bacterium]
MNSKFSKILTIIVAVISVIGIALFINVSITDDVPESISGAVGPLIGFSLYLFYAAVLITVVLSIRGLVNNPENLKKTLIGLAAMGVLLVIAYILGDSEAVLDAQGNVLKGGELGSSSNQWVGSLIWYSSILVLIGGIFFVYDLAKGLVKN